METETALIRTYRTVKLNTETSVYLNLSVVINPGNAECDNSFRLYQSFDKACLFIFRVLFDYRLKRFKNLFYRL